MKEKFTWEIIEHIAVLSEKGTVRKELNIVKFGDGVPKYDVRGWYCKPGEPPVPRKGLHLTGEEITALKIALMQRHDIPDHNV